MRKILSSIVSTLALSAWQVVDRVPRPSRKKHILVPFSRSKISLFIPDPSAFATTFLMYYTEPEAAAVLIVKV